MAPWLRRPKSMIEIEEAQERIVSAVKPLSSAVIPLSAAAGRILAESIVASVDLPLFDNSAMDGYAVRAEDISKTSRAQPVFLRLVGQVAAGDSFPGAMVTGTCVRLFTGSPLPSGADAVVMQEETELDDSQRDAVGFFESPKPWENIRFKGEDVRKGTLLAASGDRLTAGRISLLAAAGCAEATVTRQPVVGLIATGSELREPGETLSPGAIYESNRLCMAALVSQTGAIPKIYPLVKDSLKSIQMSMEQALAECDAVVTSGGVSVGEFDFVKGAFQSLGGELTFWKVAVKPGRPFAFGQWRNKPLFGLPGNPVSSLVTCLLLVRPALLRLQGAKELYLPQHPATLSEPLVNTGDRRHFMRVEVDATGKVRSSGVQASHVLSSLARANGLVDVPPRSILAGGEIVSVLRWD
jgi:molybdopterin molybdotransferase